MGGSDRTECRGKIQRVVDGEVHEFSNLQHLVELLQSMLPKTKQR
jgi:hypothetical protein